MAKAIKTAIIAAVVVYITIQTLGAFSLIPAATLTTFGGVTAMATFMASATFLTTLISSGIGMLTSKGMDASRDNFGTKIAAKGAALPRQLVYGQCRIGGTIVKMECSGADFEILHLAIVLAGHEIESIEKLHINEFTCTLASSTQFGETVQYVTNSELLNSANGNAFSVSGTNNRLIRFTFHNGSQTAVDGMASNNLSSSYPSTCKFQGMAYVYMELVYDAERLPNVPNIWFEVKGKKVYDPRDDSTAWSNNPALIVRDLLMDTSYGLKALSTEINDTTASGGFQLAANICDATVDIPSSATEKRYTLNGMSHAAASLDGLLEGFLSSCSGAITYTNGKFNMFAGGAQTPALTLTDDNVLGDIQVSTNVGSGELYNGVKALFVDKDNKYLVTEATPYEDSTYLAADTPSGAASANYRKFFEAQLPFTSTYTMAQRLQRIQLRKQRETTSVGVLTSIEFMRCQPSDWVQMTNSRLNYTNKNFEIVSMQMEFLESEGVVFAATRLNLQSVSSSIYNYAASDYTVPQATASPPEMGDMSIPPPTNLSLTQQTEVSSAYVVSVRIVATWTNSSSNAIQGTEVQMKKSGEADTAYVTAGIAGKGVTSFLITDGVVGTTYVVRIRHQGWDSVYSDWVL